MIDCNCTCKFKFNAIDPSKSDTSFLLFISNLRKTRVFKTSLFVIGHICLPEVLRRIYRHLRNINGAIAHNH